MNTTKFIPSVVRSWLLGAVVLLGLAPPAPCAQDITRTFSLQPGWNALYLEIELAEQRPEVVFTNLPVASVWTWNARLSATDFIQDLTEEAWNTEKWLVWFPKSRIESRFNNLFALLPRRAYLVKLLGSNLVTLTLTGRPSLRQPEWAANAYNLRGFPVDRTMPPTFLEFFRHSPAHYDAGTSRLQAMYRINPAGRWNALLPGERMQRGEAYWVFTKGASDYVGPTSLEVAIGPRLKAGDGLDYGLEAAEMTLRFLNHTTQACTHVIGHLGADPLPLSWRDSLALDPKLAWLRLPWPYHYLETQPGQATELRLAARRAEMTGTSCDTVLEIRDYLGTLFYVPLSVRKEGVAAAPAPLVPAARASRQAKDEPPVAPDFTGLWLGSAKLTAVGEVNAANPSNPTPVKAEFDLRLLIHVDTNGQACLLKEVTLMQQPPVYTNAPDGYRVLARTGRAVLLTEPSLIPQFAGVSLREGTPVGRRISSAHFEFDNAPHLGLSGSFGLGGRLSATFTLPAQHPVNPFRHKYHPDHDNLDATFTRFRAEAFDVTRAVELEFTASDPDGRADPDYGHNTVAGLYREQISGLHKQTLHLQGVFRLKRIAAVGALNPPAPTP